MAEDETLNDAAQPAEAPGDGDLEKKIADLEASMENVRELKARVEDLQRTLDEVASGNPEEHAKLIKSFLKEDEVHQVLDEAAQRSAETAIKASFDHRLDRIKEEVKKGLEVAGNDILAQVKGSLEGKVLASVHEATTSKDFRNILRDITSSAANQALKEAGKPLLDKIRSEAEENLREGMMMAMKEAGEGLDKRIEKSLASFARTEAFQDAIREVAGPALAGVASKAGEGLDEEAVSAIVTRALADLPAPAAGTDEETVHAWIEQAVAGLPAPSASGLDEGAVRILVDRAMEDSEPFAEKLDAAVETAVVRAEEGVSGKLRDLEAKLNDLEQEAGETREGDSGLSAVAVRTAIKEGLTEMENRVHALEEAPHPAGEGGAEGGVSPQVQAQIENLFKRIADLEKFVDSQGEPEEGLKIETVKELIKKSSKVQLAAMKEMVKKLQTAVTGAIDKEIKKKTKDMAAKEEVKALIEQVMEAMPSPQVAPASSGAAVDAEAIRTQVQKELSGELEGRVNEAVKAQFSGTQAQDLLKDLMGPEFIERTVQDILESDLFSSFLNSDEMKELLDDKFKIMRNWLKSDEIPKQVKKFTSTG